MVRILLTILCFVSLLTPAFGQKVKYKDLFVLLNAKQYDQAEPFLRKYLAENDDNPNAYLFMGIIFQEKAAHNDVLKHTEIMINNLDSAVIFYDKAYKQMDEKEIKRNDEYYQAYNRRDLRTGKFGVKLSDVQFDIEKKMQALKERKVLVRELKTHYDNAESRYAKAQFLFKDIQLKYGNVKTLFLRSDESTISNMKRVAQVFDSAILAFKSYKDISATFGNTGYNQELDLKEITSLENDGTSSADFMQDKLALWDYKRWADNTIAGIEKVVLPMRENLISYDIEINKLREKLKKDSVSVQNDLTKLVDKILYTQLKKYDPNPLPMDVFGMKIAELEYLSELINNKPFRDSANIKLRLGLIEKELEEIKKLDSVSTKLAARDLETDVLDYNHFVNSAYGTSAVLKSLVKTTKDFADREKERKEKDFERLSGALRWMVSETDSIPLFKDVPDGSKFKPLVLVEEKFTAGFQYVDTVATGYFSTINPARKGGVSVSFPINNNIFTRNRLPVTKALSASDENGQVFYVLFYSEEKLEEKFPVTVAKIYRTDGLAWSSNFSFEMLPAEVSFQVESGEVAVKTSNPAGESKMVFIDKNGKRKNAGDKQ
jgi:tetratricopeptide (TPR) repeat protein